MAGQQGQGSSEGGSNTAWLIALIFGAMIFIWYQYHTQFIFAYIWMKTYELSFLEKLSYVLPDHIDEDVLSMLEYLIINPYTQDPGIIAYIAEKTGLYLAAFQGMIASISFYFIWQKNAQLRFNKKYQMMELAKQEQYNWPQIMPVIGLNLIDIDINEGPWAMALSPLQFSKKNGLIKIETVFDRKSPWKTEGVKKINVLKDKATLAFNAQMGALWEGEYELPEHRRALFAIFLACMEHDRSGSNALLKALSISYTRGCPDFSLVHPLIQKHRASKKAAECVHNHAYVLTVLASMLQAARNDGVLASSDFIWLKPIDRELWYMLNTMGRQTPFCEVAGPFAHWKAEKELSRPLFRPIIAEAVRALEEALDKIVYTEEETVTTT